MHQLCKPRGHRLIQLELPGQPLHVLVRLDLPHEAAALHLPDLHRQQPRGAPSPLQHLVELFEVLLLRVLPLPHRLVQPLHPAVLDHLKLSLKA